MAVSSFNWPASPSRSFGPRARTTTKWSWRRVTSKHCRNSRHRSATPPMLPGDIDKLHPLGMVLYFALSLTALVAQVEGQSQDIMDTRNDRQRDSNGDTPSHQNFRRVSAKDLVQKSQRHTNDLGGGVGLAKPAWFEHFHNAGGIEQRAYDQNNYIAAEDQDRHPPCNDFG